MRSGAAEAPRLQFVCGGVLMHDSLSSGQQRDEKRTWIAHNICPAMDAFCPEGTFAKLSSACS